MAATSADPLDAAILHLPYLVFCAGALLGWRFHRSKIVFAQIALGLVYTGVRLGAPAGEPAGAVGDYLLAALAVALPLYLTLLFYQREAGLLSLRGALRLATLAALAGVAAWGLQRPEWLLPWLRPTLLPGWLFPEGVVSQPGMLISALACVVLLAVRGREAPALRWAFALTVALSATGLHGAASWLPGPQGLYLQAGLLGGAGLALVFGVIQLSYGMAYLDGLTGLPGRRALEEELDRLSGTYAIAMLDVDHFKKFNDRHGHEVGDQVLKLVATRMGQVGGRGKAYRYGGEEFTVVFAGREVKEVLPHLEALRESIADSKLTIRSFKRPRKKPASPKARKKPGRKVSVTVSIGVAGPTAKQPAVRMVLKTADKALYRAKRAGRNRVKK